MLDPNTHVHRIEMANSITHNKSLELSNQFLLHFGELYLISSVSQKPTKDIISCDDLTRWRNVV